MCASIGQTKLTDTCFGAGWQESANAYHLIIIEIPLHEMRERMEITRYERKFWLPRSSVREAIVALRLQPVFFRPVYHPRRINNIYFDTLEMRDRQEHAESFGCRQKVRIRWYGNSDQATNPCLEIKHKQGEVGHKDEFALPDFIPANIDEGHKYTIWLRSLNMPENIKAYLNARRPVLFNSYQREYWRSLLGNYRVTIDSDIKSWFINNGFSSGLKQSSITGVIIELKYDKQHQLSAMDQVGKYWPWRPVRFSKYIAGLEQLLP